MTLNTSRQLVSSTQRLRVLFIAAAGLLYTGAFFLTPIAALGRHPKTGEPFDRLGFTLWQLFHLPDLAADWFAGGPGLISAIDRLPIIGFAAVLIVVAYGMGRGVLNALGLLDVLSRAERVVFGVGLGLNGLSLGTLLVGLLGWLREPLGVAMVATFATCLLALNWTTGKLRGRTSPQEPREPFGRIEWLLVAGVAAFSILILLGGLLPPWHFDVRAYHLQAPKEWYTAGAISFMPHNVYANMPLAAEMHALLAMMLWPGDNAWWPGAIVGKVVIASFAPLTALALYSFGRRFLTPTTGLAAAFLFITTPWVAFLSFTGLIECVLGFYLLLGFYALALRARLTEDESAGRHRGRSLLVVSGLCAGAAAACKYPSLVFVVLPLLTLAAFPKLLQMFGPASAAASKSPSGLRPCLTVSAIFALSVFAACGPWYLKNLAQTGNPTYPLLSSVFGQGNWSEQQHERWSTAHSPPADQNGNRHSATQLVGSAIVLGWNSTGHSVALLPFAAVAVFAAPRRKFVLLMLVFVVYFVAVWWLVTHRFGRFVTPLLPVLALMAAVAVASLLKTRARSWLVAALCLVALLNALLATSSVLGDNRFFMPLADARASRVSTIHRYLNESLHDNERVLLVGDATPLELEVPHLYNTCFDDCRFTQLMQGRDASARRAALHEAGITHIWFSWIDIAAYRRDGDYGYSPYVTHQRVHDEFVQGDRLLRPVRTGVDPRFGVLCEVTEEPGGEGSFEK